MERTRLATIKKGKSRMDASAKLISELETCRDLIKQCIVCCTSKFTLPPIGHVTFARGISLSYDYIRGELGKYNTGIEGQIEAWRTGEYRGMTISPIQLRSGLTTMISALDKELEMWALYSIGGPGVEDMMAISERLKKTLL